MTYQPSNLSDSPRKGPIYTRDFHLDDDVDALVQSHHHTLGTLPTQAAAGNHSHTELRWDDLRVSLLRSTVGANTPTLSTFLGGTQLYAFSATKLEEVFFDVQMPHSWANGTEVHPHIHWAPSNTNTGVVRWGLEYTMANYGVVFPATTTIYIEQAGSGVSHQHQLAMFPAIAMTGGTDSRVFSCRFFRDGAHTNDTYTGTAFGMSFDLHYQSDNRGSLLEIPS